MRTRHAISRRGFLKVGAAAAVVAPYVAPATALGQGGRPAPSDRITMGFIGLGGMGSGDMGGLLGFPEVQGVAVCDVDYSARSRAKQGVEGRYAQQKASGVYKGCDDYGDFREVVTRPDIDAISCGTPDHWHALITVTAMKNGKDVFCQKPETLTIREGRIMVETARRYGRVFSGGSQRVWEDYNWYHRVMWGGVAGKLQEVFINIGGPSGEMLLPAEPVPEGLDWDMWLGPAPWRPYNKGYHPFNWRGCRDFSGGGMTDWGAHHVGGGLFAAQLHDKPVPVEVHPPDGKEFKHLTYIYADGVRLYLGGAWDGPLGFKGDLGEVPERGKPRIAPPPTYIQGYKGRGGILGDFIHCVKTRERPFRDIELAHRTMVTCHLANIAFWSGRSFKFDPVKEEIVGDPELNRWVDRPYRAPWTL
ncbi:MAG TPA: Gfo/Idh/MocA family oxidoreductase [Planctomycetota bacterium]|nr:Gfo/Idh/MocA family oxidoreductase [Planctomycetota bacterium]HRR83006.1 Gfo/Idh/MocA family oxidoreductase [Planctomycetota bacterium]HRT96715.1 Gfo/Idh/MocA family oxidoreductase [Planctomycetota bacterium]